MSNESIVPRLAVVETKVETHDEMIREMYADIKYMRSTIDHAKGSWAILNVVITSTIAGMVSLAVMLIGRMSGKG